MPVYTYQVVHEDGTEGEMFEVVRRMSDPPLTQHPETGEPVRRVYQPVNIAGAHSERNMLSNENLTKHGFTKYERKGKGEYERTAGTAGPKQISSD